jgi:hypothetical protein
MTKLSDRVSADHELAALTESIEKALSTLTSLYAKREALVQARLLDAALARWNGHRIEMANRLRVYLPGARTAQRVDGRVNVSDEKGPIASYKVTRHGKLVLDASSIRKAG